MDSDPGSPISVQDHESVRSEGHYSEVPTEPMPPQDQHLVREHMARQRQFLSDYERYNPVQNMHMLANHVFGLSEQILELNGSMGSLNGNMNSLKADSTSSRRLIDLVSANQHEANGSIRELGDDVTATKADIKDLRKEVGELKRSFEESRQETQDGLNELKSMLSLLLGSQLKG